MKALTPNGQAWLKFINKIADDAAVKGYGAENVSASSPKNQTDTPPADPAVRDDVEAFKKACHWAARVRGLDPKELRAVVKARLRELDGLREVVTNELKKLI